MKAGRRNSKNVARTLCKELSQLHFRDTFEPIHPRISDEQRKEVLESHLFLKEKRDTAKGRMVAGKTNNAARLINSMRHPQQPHSSRFY
jgi:hypothetical protein